MGHSSQLLKGVLDMCLLALIDQEPSYGYEMVDKLQRNGLELVSEGSIYPLLATGQFAGSLIHSPNIYDFPVSLHLARIMGGDAVWVHNGQSVNFDELWMDDRADMLRLPGIVACAVEQKVLDTLCDLARDWNPQRYAD